MQSNNEPSVDEDSKDLIKKPKKGKKKAGPKGHKKDKKKVPSKNQDEKVIEA